MQTEKTFLRWMEQATDDLDLHNELAQLHQTGNTAGVEDRFYRTLEFGTGGLRGEIGAGTNRINIYTVRKATQGLANYILASGVVRKVAIAYDSRIKSDLFAQQAAQVFAANGITAMLYPQLMPTPALSFAVRHLGCGAGVCVTASHNPAKYNGYKVYGADGCQITTEAATEILAQIETVDEFDDVKITNFDTALQVGQICYIGQQTVDAYIAAVKTQQVTPGQTTSLKVVYTPLNGAGLACVTRILTETGITDITVVPEQEHPDGNFPTCPYPNPEIREALQKGLELSATVQPDLLLATDPDCDRVGIAVNNNGTFELMSGNEVGVLLLDYICKQRAATGTLPLNPVAVKTIVTTDMAASVAQKYGVELREVLTGFKFIGEQIGLLENAGEENRYIFGFEESYGYLSGGYVRDKDAVNASMLICEMARFYKAQGKTLLDVMQQLYAEHGYYAAHLLSFSFEGMDGMLYMQNLMKGLRTAPPQQVGGYAVLGSYDYLQGAGSGQLAQVVRQVPKADVLEFLLEGEAKLIVRPSGTEPKIKVYLFAKGQTQQTAKAEIEKLAVFASQMIEKK
ncbi:phospho-sugar mutase [Ruminococcaceae bacterium OttesenSCG-928-A16]|nr:phospho-sugar mutase [Ruminococcaceae bacterium OttesenSCG-928-A16]